MGSNKSFKNRKTAYSDVMSDYSTRLNLREEDLFDLVNESFSKLKEGPYLGTIVQADYITRSGRIRALIRIPEIHDYLIPAGCGKTPDEHNLLYKSMLIPAISKFSSNNTNIQNADAPESYENLVVEVTFPDGAPTNSGQMRGATFSLIPSPLRSKAGSGSRFCYKSAIEGKPLQWNALNFKKGGNHLESQKTTPPETNVIIGAPKKLTHSEFIEKLKDSGAFTGWTPESVCGLIANAQHESKLAATVGGDAPRYWLKGIDEDKPGSKEYNKKVKRYNIAVSRAIKGHGSYGEAFYCAWGFWQMQVCMRGAAGRVAAEKLNIDTSTEEGRQKWKDWVSDESNQIKYVAKLLTEKKLHQFKDHEIAAYEICVKFEQPANAQAEGKHRKKTSDKIWKEHKTAIKDFTKKL